ncbi:MAG TPA: hypothetical protein DCP57_01255 [Gammaproteobacteria bacterium]|nr:MAG: hypothetical protein CBC94_007100 [Gammaproteobacteria bacterium TMED134]RZO71992.1 MAG: hypothetical protein EVA67_02890 [OM182 bacterium]HAL41040.1 hypothetical protein [Gammaproteobacteria bacterium]|tara:strand:+ start:12511 stop:13665 length:1155 start_codon:yes stop_codon:yes gene_type:complete
MGQNVKRSTRGLLAALILCCLTVGSSASELDQSTLQLTTIVERLNALDRWLTDSEQQLATLQQSLREQDRDIGTLAKQRRALDQALAAVHSDIKNLEAQRQQLANNRDQQQEAVAAHLRAAARLGSEDLIQLVVSQRSPSELNRLIRYHTYFSQQRLGVIERLQKTVADLAKTNADLIAEHTLELEQQRALTEQSARLEARRSERTVAIAELAKLRSSREQERSALVADRARLQSLIASLNRAARALDGEAFRTAKGRLIAPLRGTVRHAFNSPQGEGDMRWRGIDFEAPTGTAVSAVFEGRVVFAEWLRGYGLMAIIDHGDGYMTTYGNADTLYKSAGDWVEAGELIADAGNSGGRFKSGIYFELRHEGEVQDPSPWLEADSS